MFLLIILQILHWLGAAFGDIKKRKWNYMTEFKNLYFGLVYGATCKVRQKVFARIRCREQKQNMKNQITYNLLQLWFFN